VRIVKTVMIGALVLAAGSALWARDFNLPPGKWWENPTLVERLKLTDEQQGVIRDKVFDHALKMIDLKANVERRELELSDRVERSDFDPGQVRNAFQALQQARQRLESEHFELLLAIRQILSPEQWQALQELREERRRERPGRAMGQGPMGDRPMGDRPMGGPGGPGDQRPRQGPGR
jgi:Spy/CpxP family protein refolding chaperone